MRFHRRRSRDVPRTSRALPRLPQLAEANCDPCTPSPLPKLWRSPQGTARACPRCDPRPPESGSLSPRRHPSADRSPRPFLRIAPRRVAALGWPPPRRKPGFRRAVAMTWACTPPATRRSGCQTSSLWTRPGFVVSAAARSLEPTAAPGPTTPQLALPADRPVSLYRCLSGFAPFYRSAACFRPCRTPDCRGADQAGACAIASVSEQSTSGCCSTDESVVSTPVARRRHPILPWALFPFEVRCHRRRSGSLCTSAPATTPTIPPPVPPREQALALAPPESVQWFRLRVGFRLHTVEAWCRSLGPATPMGFSTSKISFD